MKADYEQANKAQNEKTAAPWRWARLGLGPLARYRPGLFRKHLAHGFQSDGGWGVVAHLPAWWPQWSSPEEKLLDRLDLMGQVVYDVGACAGAYSLFFSRRVGENGRVVAFEPQPKNFTKLARSLSLNRVGNVQALQLALGASNGPRPLFKLPGMSTTASLAPEANALFRIRAGAAQVARLDDLVNSRTVPPPHFMKIDVEGMEVDVLQGALETLAQHRPSLLIEVHGTSRRAKANCMRQLATLLAPLGYTLTHAESGQRWSADAASVPAFGHVFAEAT